MHKFEVSSLGIFDEVLVSKVMVSTTSPQKTIRPTTLLPFATTYMCETAFQLLPV